MVLPIGQVPKRPKFGSGLKPGQLPASVSGQQRPGIGQRPPQGFGASPRFGQPTERISPSYQPPTVPVGGRPQATPAPPMMASPGVVAPQRPDTDLAARMGGWPGQPANPGYQPPQQPSFDPSRQLPGMMSQAWQQPPPGLASPLSGPLASLTDEEFRGMLDPERQKRLTPTQIAAIQKEHQRRYNPMGDIGWIGGPPPYQPGQSPAVGPQQQPAQQPVPFPQQQPGGFPSPEITSGINPQPVFQPYQTQTAVNQAMGSAQQAALTPGQGYLPGIGQGSPALQSRSVVDQAGELASGYQQAEQIRLGDRMTNVQALLQGQQARAQDVLGQAGNRFGVSATNQQYGNQMANLMLSGILSRLGGAGNLLGNQLGDRNFWARLGLTGQQGRTQDILSRFGTLGQLYDTGGF